MRLIDADKLKKSVLDLPNCYNGFSDTYDKACILDVIDEQPTIEPQTGKWIDDGSELGCQCSECCKSLDEYIHVTECMTLIEIPKFCPNCGARMVME